MAYAVLLPNIGGLLESGTILRWTKKEGERVHKGDVLFEIETQKANLEVESFSDGILLKIYVQAGIPVPLDTVVACIGQKGEKAPKNGKGLLPPPGSERLCLMRPNSSAIATFHIILSPKLSVTAIKAKIISAAASALEIENVAISVEAGERVFMPVLRGVPLMSPAKLRAKISALSKVATKGFTMHQLADSQLDVAFIDSHDDFNAIAFPDENAPPILTVIYRHAGLSMITLAVPKEGIGVYGALSKLKQIAAKLEQ